MDLVHPLLVPSPFFSSKIHPFPTPKPSAIQLLIFPGGTRLPLYAYFRLVLLSYLVLPQTQGARLLYQSHIHPFLARHESDIDTLITHAHDRAKAAGLSSLKRFIDFVKENLLGIPPKSPSSSSFAYQGRDTGGSYAQNLLSRFNLPSARQGLAAPAGDFYGLLSTALGQPGTGGGGGGRGRDIAPVEELSRSGTLFPQGLTSTAEKKTFLTTQRERLRLLLTALDREASGLEHEEMLERDVERRLGDSGATATATATGAAVSSSDGLRKSKSEAEFENIEREDDDWSGGKTHKALAGSWVPWGLWGSSDSPDGAKGKAGERGSSG